MADPWRPGALDAVPDDGDVLLVGSGLTAVDLAITLARENRWCTPCPGTAGSRARTDPVRAGPRPSPWSPTCRWASRMRCGTG